MPFEAKGDFSAHPRADRPEPSEVEAACSACGCEARGQGGYLQCECPALDEPENDHKFTGRAHEIICDAAGSDQSNWSTYDHGLLNIAREADETIAELVTRAEAAEKQRDDMVALYTSAENSHHHMKGLLTAAEAKAERQEIELEASDATSFKLRGALKEASTTLAAAFNRIHGLPRTADTELAQRLGVARAQIAAVLKEPEHGN